MKKKKKKKKIRKTKCITDVFQESIIPYVRPGVIKDELNELFRQKHPWVPTGVTLHKIRKLKKALVLISVAGV